MKKVVIIIMCAASLISCNNSQKTEVKEQEQMIEKLKKRVEGLEGGKE